MTFFLHRPPHHPPVYMATVTPPLSPCIYMTSDLLPLFRYIHDTLFFILGFPPEYQPVSFRFSCPYHSARTPVDDDVVK